MLQQDHNAANQKAMDAAKKLSVNAPSARTAKQKADYDEMAKLQGAAFDKAFRPAHGHGPQEGYRRV